MTFKENKLAELCEIVSSKRVFAASYQSKGIPFFRGKEISQLARGENTTAELYISEEVYADVVSRTGPVNSGDILLTAVGTLGNPYQVMESDLPFYFKDGNIVWLRKFSDEINSAYLFYWLNSEYGRRKVLDTAIGSTQPALTITGLGGISINYPSYAHQTRIVKILSAIDQKIAINKSLSKTLEDITKTIFKSWFVDFDPVKAKMAGEQPAGMDDATAALFPDSMEESELGLIPIGWNVSKLRNHLQVTKGKSYKSSELEESDTALVTLKSFKRGGGYRFDGLKPFSGEFKPEQIVEPGDLIVSFTDVTQAADVIGKPAIVFKNPSFSRLVASLDVGIVRPLDNGVGKHYLYQLFSTPGFKNHIDGYTNGTTVLHLGKGALEDFTVALPGSKIMSKYEMFASTALGQSQALYLENLTLEAIRDSLLPRLISGDLQIPEEMLAS